jgi:hypothetical protein
MEPDDFFLDYYYECCVWFCIMGTTAFVGSGPAFDRFPFSCVIYAMSSVNNRKKKFPRSTQSTAPDVAPHPVTALIRVQTCGKQKQAIFRKTVELRRTSIYGGFTMGRIRDEQVHDREMRLFHVTAFNPVTKAAVVVD